MLQTDGQSVGFLDEKAAARYLRASVAWLRKKRRLGGGPPFHKFDALVRYSFSDLQTWTVARRKEGQ